ncbi:MAG: hypothetical protein CVV64_08855 [Candidatus Wallbacteria bacterium HGW-Wallbacteria-1]|uniref:Spermidine synthase n=1 Tax=Candidatus Wallbacteria bacterium HGW-Wallbacteria-1 TaxID=2013854 RepID=A0A2N1PQ55_9BACT|nr:MAG: hypothetical protein CVV64_08855 [Candidatus Wallbacteria bacterium HGW-Wallbacteria-1]
MERIAVFLSSFTIFAMELGAAKALLPTFGGSYLVWGTCLIFFQAVLFLGYAGVHMATRLIGHRALTILHSLLALLSLSFLPLAIRQWDSAGSEHLTIILTLAVSVGIPFLLLSTTSPLVQFWTSTKKEKESYHLFSWSNSGSLAGLLSYPLILERVTGIEGQFKLFTVLFILWIIIMIPMALSHFMATGRKSASAPVHDNEAEIHEHSFNWVWLCSPILANAMMLTITNLLVWDMVSIPLMWVLPLAIFLVTFILNFRTKPIHSILMDRLFHLSLIAMLLIHMATRLDFDLPALPLRFTYLMILFFVCMKCQRMLYISRPQCRESLFGYYSAMALGGIIGTALISFFLPLATNTLTEVPLSIAATALITMIWDRRNPVSLQGNRWRDGIILTLVISLLLSAAQINQSAEGPPMIITGGAIAALALLLGRQKEARWAVAVGAVLFLLISSQTGSRGSFGRQILFQTRNFYGIHRVIARQDQRILQHGSTFHGRQYTDKARESIPLSYYHRTTPLGKVFTNPVGSLNRCALIGLGTGALTTYQKSGQHWTWLELDPEVVKIAEKWFTYLSMARGKIDFVTGDARITLRKQPEKSMDLITVDAFSGDSIPVHLLTMEAMKEFWSRCGDNGLVLYHISSRYFNLEPVLAAAASTLDLKAMILIAQDGVAEDADPCRGFAVFSSQLWQERLKSLGFREAVAGPTQWTDDYASILDVLSLVDIGQGE